MSITKKQDGIGLVLSICKNLIEMNGGEIMAKSQLGKDLLLVSPPFVSFGTFCQFCHLFPVCYLLPVSPPFASFAILEVNFESQFNKQVRYALPHTIRRKRILIIYPVENVRNSMLKYLKRIDAAFDTFDKGIKAAKVYKELNGRPAYDIAFISLYEIMMSQE
ncbi:protein-histidine kinase [Gigaspora margarita]|uniref:Protein-histidine kinase n=1 Tax=Gigaspora margarita TaxID=4874 RepID=A0A8H4AZK3_GIGMA|nr:protein-histidine kinase [Gigaspora margarita]